METKFIDVTVEDRELKSLENEVYSEIREIRKQLQIATEKLQLAISTLEKISDPSLRDHYEPDDYTTLGCLMHMADEALGKIKDLHGKN